MSRYSTKYGCGDNVSVYGIPGRITAIHIRGKNRSYSVGYVDDGSPSEVHCDEIEIERGVGAGIGFRKGDRDGRV